MLARIRARSRTSHSASSSEPRSHHQRAMLLLHLQLRRPGLSTRTRQTRSLSRSRSQPRSLSLTKIISSSSSTQSKRSSSGKGTDGLPWCRVCSAGTTIATSLKAWLLLSWHWPTSRTMTTTSNGRIRLSRRTTGRTRKASTTRMKTHLKCSGSYFQILYKRCSCDLHGRV